MRRKCNKRSTLHTCAVSDTKPKNNSWLISNKTLQPNFFMVNYTVNYESLIIHLHLCETFPSITSNTLS